jgi:hypothetical protein
LQQHQKERGAVATLVIRVSAAAAKKLFHIGFEAGHARAETGEGCDSGGSDLMGLQDDAVIDVSQIPENQINHRKPREVGGQIEECVL